MTSFTVLRPGSPQECSPAPVSLTSSMERRQSSSPLCPQREQELPGCEEGAWVTSCQEAWSMARCTIQSLQGWQSHRHGKAAGRARKGARGQEVCVGEWGDLQSTRNYWGAGCNNKAHPEALPPDPHLLLQPISVSLSQQTQRPTTCLHQMTE